MKKLILCFLLSFLATPQDSVRNQLSFLDSLDPDIRSQILGDAGNKGFGEEPLQIQQSLIANVGKKLENENSKFGFSFFDTKSLTNTPVLDVPLSGEYRLSFGDRVRIVLNGNIQGVYELNIGLDGTILLPEVGLVSLNKLTLQEANKRIDDRAKNVSIGTTAGIEVIKSSLRKVSVLGSVRSPGIYLVNPFISIFELVQQADGLKENASLRTVSIIKSDGTEEVIDLYDYLIFGKRNSDLSIENGDTVLIRPTSKFMKIHGNVYRPMYYEFLPGDSLERLFSFAQGLKPYSILEKISVNYVESNVIKTAINPVDLEGFEDILELYIPSSLVVSEKYIHVKGSAVSNGVYENEKFSNLEDLINNLKFSEEIYPYFAYLRQRDLRSFTKTVFTFSLSDPSTYKNFQLEDDVELFFLSRDEFEQLQRLTDLFSKETTETIERLKDLREKKEFLLNNLDVASGFYDTSTTAKISDGKQIDIQERINMQQEIDSQTTQFFRERIQEIDDEISILNASAEKKYIELDSSLNTFDQYDFLMDNSLIFTVGEEKYLFPISGKFIPKNLFNFIGLSENKFNLSSLSFVSTSFNLENFDENTLVDFIPGSVLSVSPKGNEMVEIKLNGLFNNPGTYFVPEGTSLSEAYTLGGGFTENANINGIVLSRQSLIEREKLAVKNSRNLLLESIITQSANVTSSLLGSQANSNNFASLTAFVNMADQIDYVGRVSGDLSPNSEFSSTLILEDGDAITVKPISNTITILGEVLSSNTVLYESNLSLSEYIKQAGGYSQYADKRNVYVIKANGNIVSIGDSTFRRAYRISAGDTIVVPRNYNKLQPLPLVSIATRVISDIAFAAASLNAISN